jgi:hypothetical protein
LENGLNLSENENVEIIKKENNQHVLQLNSGNYTFSIQQ